MGEIFSLKAQRYSTETAYTQLLVSGNCSFVYDTVYFLQLPQIRVCLEHPHIGSI